MRTALRYRNFWLVSAASIALAVAGCGDTDPRPSLCADDAPPAFCEASCDASSPCPRGSYCGTGGTCTAECTTGGGQCRAGETCNPADGRCVATTGDGGTGGGVGGGAGGGNGQCEDLTVTADPVEPYIIFVVDRSGSMLEAYGDTSRWTAVREALVGTGGASRGIIGAYESRARIGVVQYTGDHTSNSAPWNFVEEWPLLTEEPARLSNRDAIVASYSGEPIGRFDTPTGEALWVTMCHLGELDTDGDGEGDTRIGCDAYTSFVNASGLPMANRADVSTGAPALLPSIAAGRDPRAPVVLILASDGLPNSSKGPNADSSPGSDLSVEARQIALDAAAEARAAGVSTYVISVAGSTSLRRHLAHLACEGGTGTNPGAAPYTGDTDVCSNDGVAGPSAINVENAVQLAEAFDGILSASIPCQFTLDGTINDVPLAREQGTVTVGGEALTLDESNGWYLLDDGRTFTLNGSACEDFRQSPGASLQATFPCGGVIIIGAG